MRHVNIVHGPCSGRVFKEWMQGVRSCSCESKVHATANLCRDLRSSHGVDSHLHRLAACIQLKIQHVIKGISPQPICLHLMQWRCAWSPQGSDFAWSHSDFSEVGGNIHKADVCDMIPIKQIARIFDLGVTSSALMHFVRYYSTFLPTPSTLHLAQHLHLLSCSNILLLSTTSMLYDYIHIFDIVVHERNPGKLCRNWR